MIDVETDSASRLCLSTFRPDPVGAEEANELLMMGDQCLYLRIGLPLVSKPFASLIEPIVSCCREQS